MVKVSTLQDYGVDKFFFLENDNADTSQQSIIFIARGECARHANTIARKKRLMTTNPYPSTCSGRRANVCNRAGQKAAEGKQDWP